MKLYSNVRYKVHINTDGSIKVAAGDWLSKYSAAIHNDFWHVHEYGRRGATGTVEPIKDINRLVAGETIYHLPTYSNLQPGRRNITPQVHLTEHQKKKFIEDALKKDFNLKGEHLKVLSSAISIIGYTDNALTLMEIAGLISEGGFMSSVGSVVGITSIVLFPIGGIITLVNLNEADLRTYGMRAVAYTTTGWAFDSPIPTSSERILINKTSGFPVISKEKLERHHKAWAEASTETIKKLNEEINKLRVSKKSMQVLFRAIGENDKQKLCLALLKGFENQLSGIDLEVWQSNYHILYPD